MNSPIVDIILSLAWFAAFGILVDAIHKLNCGSIWHWNNFLSGDTCGRWKAAEAFAFISAFVWLVSGIVVRILPDNVGVTFRGLTINRVSGSLSARTAPPVAAAGTVLPSKRSTVPAIADLGSVSSEREPTYKHRTYPTTVQRSYWTCAPNILI